MTARDGGPRGASATPATPPFDAKAHVAHTATMLGLAIDPSWEPTVVTHMAAIAAAAQQVMEFPLEDSREPATVFSAR